MRATVSFSTFDPLFSDSPSLCDQCEAKLCVFQFETHGGDDTPDHRRKGFCCPDCATDLLRELQREESRAWAEEEQSVKQEMDVSEFHKRRLATFGIRNQVTVHR